MAKNKQRQRQFSSQPQKSQSSPSRPRPKGVSVRGWKVVGMGIVIVAAGFYVLSLTDPAGQNWASNLCPFLILGGYAVIAYGIVLPEKKIVPQQKISQPI